MPQTYMPTDIYHHMLDQLETVARNFDPAAPDDLRTRLIMAVGEEGGIWPASCFNGQNDERDKKIEINSVSYNTPMKALLFSNLMCEL